MTEAPLTNGVAHEDLPPASTAPLPFKNSLPGPNGTTLSATGQILNGTTGTTGGVGEGASAQAVVNELKVLCGPLLNYKGMVGASEGRTAQWKGSALVVTEPTDIQPELRVSLVEPSEAPSTMVNGIIPKKAQNHSTSPGVKLYEDNESSFWRFDIEVPFLEKETQWTYTIPNLTFASGDHPAKRSTATFFVPSANESMRIMFHSCNGFSVGTDEDAWSGPALWNDVLRVHQQKPIHVMVGGGDQIYNDGVRVDGPLRAWTEIKNPIKRRDYPFDRDLRDRADKYYFDNYVRWYSTEPFRSANCAIPQVNIWDDHDIIDGFGSYTDHFMKCHVFRGIGGVAHKYYLLFQHHVPPPLTTFTTDAPETMHSKETNGPGEDTKQLQSRFVKKDTMDEDAWIIGSKPGPYVEERSRSLYMQFGKRISFIGIDARTERTRHQINYPETYELIWNRVNAELTKQGGSIKHLIVLLGVPIAYPRLEWLQNILKSPIIGPIRLLHKRFGVAGGLFNKFDGAPDLVDDLDDHYTAHQHKHERKLLIQALQEISKNHGVRVTILGGDVHLGAFGRFYSKPKLQIPAEKDHRFIPNIVSSAITNKPPPKAVADLLAARNKIHRFDHFTDETLLNMFDKDPGSSTKTASNNHCTMPSRNYAVITETGDQSANINGDIKETPDQPTSYTVGKNARTPLHIGEDGVGTKHMAASGIHDESPFTAQGSRYPCALRSIEATGKGIQKDTA